MLAQLIRWIQRFEIVAYRRPDVHLHGGGERNGPAPSQSDRRKSGNVIALACVAVLASACVTLQPGLDAPKNASTAFSQPETTTVGKQFDMLAKQHPGTSGFHLLVNGTDSYLLHTQIVEKAERTLDAQYFLWNQDDTGQLLLEAMVAAADRGVHVRLLLDDAHDFDTGSKIRPLAVHPNIEIRVFNPFVAHKGFNFLRGPEYLLGAWRLDYRMHNKLFIGDNAVAITGGRNIGDEYFQASIDREFGDFDLAVAGPMVRQLSHSFDTYWNDRLSVPVESLPLGKPPAVELENSRKALAEHKQKMASSEYVRSLTQRDLLADMMSGKEPLVWAKAVLAYDTPDKEKVTSGEQPGRLMWKRVEQAVDGANSELIIVSPYLVPGKSEMELLGKLRKQGVRVRVLTNSLASTDVPLVHAGYLRYRIPLLQGGTELYEVKPWPGEPNTSRGLIKSGSSGAFALHAKVFVIDRQRVFVGSMNFDQRSLNINTEIGLIIESPQIAREIATRFDAIVVPANSYQLVLESGDGGRPVVRWASEESGKSVRFITEPGVDVAKRTWVEALSLMPIGRLL
jgi:putative cardiolipin synthase